MTRNAWSPEEVVSKDCRDCRKRLFLDRLKHKFYEDPELTIFHHCPNWSPRSIPNNNEVIDAINHISRLQIDHSAQLSLLKKVLWEVSQDVKRLLSQGDHE